ncbi:OmpH family outer membrane protein [Jannaschia sp. S6380]|uniref:OmpH family outer membrane protein n=1 Tax=Jannaschia sp. S6380 TaxID=2926408 RepID=UPI001FF64216|nr:OmpH family outer membrane protein [Jannaschia sp. S6380]MCK0166543.1 OmpH family outer membrane protein [Jannaschia sp. S6380]
MRAALLLAALLTVGPAAAQQAGSQGPSPSLGVPQSSVVVLDRDALFAQSMFGRRVARDIEAASAELAVENRRIESELEAEEQALTDRRAAMNPEAFRELAADFDARVTDIRQTQAAKARAITQQGERAQALFLERANPILVELARETGALVILDRRLVIASADQVDITVLAQDRIDAALGDGTEIEPSAPQPRPEGDR